MLCQLKPIAQNVGGEYVGRHYITFPLCTLSQKKGQWIDSYSHLCYVLLTEVPIYLFILSPLNYILYMYNYVT